MQEKFIRRQDTTIYYRVYGNGKPVVLLHGFGEDGEIWSDLAEALQQEYRLIVPDLPGSGQSESDITGVTMESLANDILFLLKNEGISSCTMIGHSMGGYITLAFAEKHGDMLEKLGLFHSTAFADSEEKKEGRKKNMDFISRHGSAKFLEQSVPKLFAEETATAQLELIKNIIDRYRNFSPASLVAYTAAMMNRPDRTHVLQSFSKPVLFIFGEHDTAVPLEQGLKQCSIPGIAYIYIAVRSGHMGMLEERDFCLQSMKDFLSGK